MGKGQEMLQTMIGEGKNTRIATACKIKKYKLVQTRYIYDD